MRDSNRCIHCDCRVDSGLPKCPGCAQPLVFDARGRIELWRVGELPGGIIGPMAASLGEVFGADVVIQPALIDDAPSERPRWRGHSTRVMLDQIASRLQRGTLLSLAVTAHNIVPGPQYRFVFGQGRLDGPGAVMSLHPISRDRPEHDLLIERLLKVAVHELGHNLGLEHHAYEDGVDCVMVGDVEVDSVAQLDESSVSFCSGCGATVARRIRKHSRHAAHANR